MSGTRRQHRQEGPKRGPRGRGTPQVPGYISKFLLVSCLLLDVIAAIQPASKILQRKFLDLSSPLSQHCPYSRLTLDPKKPEYDQAPVRHNTKAVCGRLHGYVVDFTSTRKTSVTSCATSRRVSPSMPWSLWTHCLCWTPSRTRHSIASWKSASLWGQHADACMQCSAGAR